MTVDFSLPDQPGYETERQIVETYGNGPDEGTHVFAVTVPEGTTVADQREQVDGVFRAVQNELPQYRVVWQGNAGDSPDAGAFVTSDDRTAYGIVVDQKLTSFDFVPAFREAEPVLAAQAEPVSVPGQRGELEPSLPAR